MTKVRQMRGPGMNKGLKKPRLAKFVNPDNDYRKSSAPRAPKERTDSKLPTFYLSDTLVPSGHKRQAPRSGGKVTSTKTS